MLRNISPRRGTTGSLRGRKEASDAWVPFFGGVHAGGGGGGG